MLVYITRRLKTLLVTVSHLAFTRGVKTVKPCGLLEKIFPGRISRQPQERGARLVTVTNKPDSRPSTTSFAFSQARNFLFLTSWKV